MDGVIVVVQVQHLGRGGCIVCSKTWRISFGGVPEVQCGLWRGLVRA